VKCQEPLPWGLLEWWCEELDKSHLQLNWSKLVKKTTQGFLEIDQKAYNKLSIYSENSWRLNINFIPLRPGIMLSPQQHYLVENCFYGLTSGSYHLSQLPRIEEVFGDGYGSQ
jgi:hypothetical protein